MSRRGVLAAVALAALALASVGATMAGAGSIERMTVKLVATEGFYIDNDPAGPSGGDLFGSQGPLRRGGNEVGQFWSACTATSAGIGECDVTMKLNRRGRVQASGRVKTEREDNKISVTGGTGDFRGAEGVAKLHRLNPDGSRQRVELHLWL
jgi:hypothetical protein